MGLGDELMVTGHVREMQLKDPRKVRVMYEKVHRYSEIFENNPRIAHPREPQGDCQIYYPRVNGLRPYCSAKSETKWTWKDYKPPVGELYFATHETHFAASHHAPDVVLEPMVKKNASPNKDWGWENWQTVAHQLRELRLTLVQLGPRGTKVLNGVRLIATENYRLAAAMLGRARAAVLPEGGLHHAAAAVGVRSVVIYGGFISPAQTGYDLHTNLFTGGEPCGRRTPCEHCRTAMAAITPEAVLARVLSILKPA